MANIAYTNPMQLGTSYKQIMAISTPIMLGSAVQNIIALSDSVFLYHLSEVDFAAIGFVSVFYLIIAAIGYGFSRGGQIMIARRVGEGNPEEVGRTFYAMTYFEIGLAIFMFLFMQFGSYYFFSLFVDSDEIFYKSLEYIYTRSYGVFFSYIGIGIVAMYTGIARTNFIMWDTLILMVVNIILNYGLIFGNFGLPEMGIAGAGLASSIAEIIAFIIFFIYILFDKEIRKFNLFKLPKIDYELIKTILRIGAPIVAQMVVGLGSWFVFFGIVENMGERQLAISNLGRMVYLALSIPCWGFSSAINTLVSNYIGVHKNEMVMPIIWKTAKLCFVVTMVISIPVIFFPEHILYPLLGGEDMSLITEARPILYVLMGILAFFTIGGVYFNGLAGTGATFYGLKIQFWCAIGYLIAIYAIVELVKTDSLVLAWSTEIVYWIVMLFFMIRFLRSDKWHGLKV